MRSGLLAAVLLSVVAPVNTSIRDRQTQQPIKQNILRETQPMSSLTGKTIRWTFADGPVAGVTFEHVLHEDGSLTWRYVGGEHKGATAREKSYAAVKVNDKTWVISYLASSVHTLTVVLDFDDHRVIGFASNDKSWYEQHGTFELR